MIAAKESNAVAEEDAIALLNRLDDVATLVNFGAVEEQAIRASLWIWFKRDHEHLLPRIEAKHPGAFGGIRLLYVRWGCGHATFEAARDAGFKPPKT
ncbi:MAG: hypothetical protein QM756_10550 [Polyangiaceae bacterium]